MTYNAEFTEGMAKNSGPILSRFGLKIMKFLGGAVHPLYSPAPSPLSISRFIPRILAVKFAIKLPSPKNVENRWFWGPRFLRGGDIPDCGQIKSHSLALANMWPVLVEFRLANSEDR